MTHAHGLCEPLREAMQPWQVLLAVLIYHCLDGSGGGGEQLTLTDRLFLSEA